jgi:hypothetical protein
VVETVAAVTAEQRRCDVPVARLRRGLASDGHDSGHACGHADTRACCEASVDTAAIAVAGVAVVAVVAVARVAAVVSMTICATVTPPPPVGAGATRAALERRWTVKMATHSSVATPPSHADAATYAGVSAVDASTRVRANDAAVGVHVAAASTTDGTIATLPPSAGAGGMSVDVASSAVGPAELPSALGSTRE